MVDVHIKHQNGEKWYHSVFDRGKCVCARKADLNVSETANIPDNFFFTHQKGQTQGLEFSFCVMTTENIFACIKCLPSAFYSGMSSLQLLYHKGLIDGVYLRWDISAENF